MNFDNHKVLRDGSSFVLIDSRGNAFGLVDDLFFYQQKTKIDVFGEPTVRDILDSTGRNRVEFAAAKFSSAFTDNQDLCFTNADGDFHSLAFADSDVPVAAINAVRETAPSLWKVSQEQSGVLFAYIVALIGPIVGGVFVGLIGWLLCVAATGDGIQGAIGSNHARALIINAVAQTIGPNGVRLVTAVGVLAVVIWFAKRACNVKRDYVTLFPIKGE